MIALINEHYAVLAAYYEKSTDEKLSNADSANLPVYEARFEIDRLLRDDLNNFANARESMKHVFSLQSYADVMSAFAAGERYINRVWSASTDGYVDEVHNYLDRATQQIREARVLFVKLQQQYKSEKSFNWLQNRWL